ncbi:MAG: anhydro-N-acetylmuramic acid kinase [Rhodospirillaceae bacterium]|nr:anhydro-N-acetylmuramic acid kinase [Rhodospirillaceae bacterium]
MGELNLGLMSETSQNSVGAVLFAWLARVWLRREPGNAPTVTGARRSATLGSVYYGVHR